MFPRLWFYDIRTFAVVSFSTPEYQDHDELSQKSYETELEAETAAKKALKERICLTKKNIKKFKSMAEYAEERIDNEERHLTKLKSIEL